MDARTAAHRAAQLVALGAAAAADRIRNAARPVDLDDGSAYREAFVPAHRVRELDTDAFRRHLGQLDALEAEQRAKLRTSDPRSYAFIFGDPDRDGLPVRDPEWEAERDADRAALHHPGTAQRVDLAGPAQCAQCGGDADWCGYPHCHPELCGALEAGRPCEDCADDIDAILAPVNRCAATPFDQPCTLPPGHHGTHRTA